MRTILVSKYQIIINVAVSCKLLISANSMGIIDFINNHLNLFFEFLRNKSFTNQELESLVPGKDYSHVEEQLIWIIEVYITILKTAVLWQIVRQLWK